MSRPVGTSNALTGDMYKHAYQSDQQTAIAHNNLLHASAGGGQQTCRARLRRFMRKKIRGGKRSWKSGNRKSGKKGKSRRQKQKRSWRRGGASSLYVPYQVPPGSAHPAHVMSAANATGAQAHENRRYDALHT